MRVFVVAGVAIAPALLMIAALSPSAWAEGSCLLEGRRVAGLRGLQVRPPGVTPFTLEVHSSPASVRLSAGAAEVLVDVGGPIAFKAHSLVKDLVLSTADAAVLAGGQLTLPRRKLVGATTAVDGGVRADIEFGRGLVAEAVFVPCARLSLDRPPPLAVAPAISAAGSAVASTVGAAVGSAVARAVGSVPQEEDDGPVAVVADPRGAAPKYAAAREVLVLRERPGDGETLTLRVSHPRRLPLLHLGTVGAHRLVSATFDDGVSVKGYAARDALLLLSCAPADHPAISGIGNVSGYGCGGSHDYYGSATIAAGTRIFAGHGIGPWGTFVDDEKVQVLHRVGERWVSVTRVAGLRGLPRCGRPPGPGFAFVEQSAVTRVPGH